MGSHQRQVASFTFFVISWRKIVQFSFCKKLLTAGNVLYDAKVLLLPRGRGRLLGVFRYVHIVRLIPFQSTGKGNANKVSPSFSEVNFVNGCFFFCSHVS